MKFNKILGLFLVFVLIISASGVVFADSGNGTQSDTSDQSSDSSSDSSSDTSSSSSDSSKSDSDSKSNSDSNSNSNSESNSQSGDSQGSSSYSYDQPTYSYSDYSEGDIDSTANVNNATLNHTNHNVTKNATNHTNATPVQNNNLGDNSLVIGLTVGVFIVVAAIVVVYFKLE
jgi:cytoskeletal protein RodZ